MKKLIFLSILSVLFISCNTKIKIDSIEKVQEYAIGTWIGEEEVLSKDKGEIVKLKVKLKYVISNEMSHADSVYNSADDGGFKVYSMLEDADDWGEPIFSGHWKADSSKYSDTGEKFYCIRFSWKEWIDYDRPEESVSTYEDAGGEHTTYRRKTGEDHYFNIRYPFVNEDLEVRYENGSVGSTLKKL